MNLHKLAVVGRWFVIERALLQRFLDSQARLHSIQGMRHLCGPIYTTYVDKSIVKTEIYLCEALAPAAQRSPSSSGES
jgi:hypothetical protein